MKLIGEVYTEWLNGKQTTYALFLQFSEEIHKRALNDEVTLVGSTCKTLRLQYSREKGLTKIHKIIKSYWKTMHETGNFYRLGGVWWYIYSTPYQLKNNKQSKTL